LSGILNAFDGIVSLDDRLIFLTTNVLSSIDPAMIRPGRVDHVIEVGYLKDSTIREYIAMMFPGRPNPIEQFAPIAGCQLQQYYLENSDDYEAFVASIPRTQP
jgi:SpoVK/Ycf46/Vps4 family AAA+-type ATPase